MLKSRQYRIYRYAQKDVIFFFVIRLCGIPNLPIPNFSIPRKC